LSRHAPLGFVIVACAIVYAHVSGAGFCAYDDFNESYRAAFFDAKMPSRIITAMHFTGFMYRPVTSALQLATWQALDHSPLAFRLRNLAMHLVVVAMVYGIALLLARSRAVALGAAALFAFNPLANEAVVVAIWTNTTAYALILTSFFLFLLALRAQDAGKTWVPPLVVSLVLVLIALFTYEPTIVIFGIMCAYLALCRRSAPALSRAFWLSFAGGTLLDIGLFFIIRHVMGVGSADLLSLGEIVRDLGVYLVALALPIDPVLDHALFGVPLPVAGASFTPKMFAAPLIGAVALLALFALVTVRPLSAGAVKVNWGILAFLLVSIPISLVPIVLFKPHVSEFNLYVPAVFYALFVCIFVRRFSRDRRAYAAVIAVLLLSYVAGSCVRNERVVACARIATRIVDSLPIDTWREGQWRVRIATAPGELLSPRYGIYDYSGIETIEVKSTMIPGAQEAVRLASGNENVQVDVVPAERLKSDCLLPKTCFYVFDDGRVTEGVSFKRKSQTFSLPLRVAERSCGG
jgi:hypothetical protein